MSHISFNSSDGDVAEVRGTEVAYLSILFADLALGCFGVNDLDPNAFNAVHQFLPPNSGKYVVDPSQPGSIHERLQVWLYSAKSLQVDGQVIPVWPVLLNTIASIGNDSMRALAFIFGTSTEYGWIRGQHGPWLADLLETARKSNILRANAGWEDVIELLRDNKTGPIVLNHSTNYDFPNIDLLPNDTPIRATFDQLSRDERWSIATGHLVPTQELSPATIGEIRYSVDGNFKTGIHTMLDMRARFLDKP